MILFSNSPKSGNLIKDKILAFARVSLLLVILKGHDKNKMVS